MTTAEGQRFANRKHSLICSAKALRGGLNIGFTTKWVFCIASSLNILFNYLLMTFDKPICQTL